MLIIDAEGLVSGTARVIVRRLGSSAVNATEMKKMVPARYPSNVESVGVELVGRFHLPVTVKAPPNSSPKGIDKLCAEYGVYEIATGAQNASLHWLIGELCASLPVPVREVHRHPEVSWKNRTEAACARWQ